uniref:Uncharacterized protein n=1 Tax=Arundo donax TaxID=35708 RepID=A0A0A9FSR0_ARUDO
MVASSSEDMRLPLGAFVCEQKIGTWIETLVGNSHDSTTPERGGSCPLENSSIVLPPPLRTNTTIGGTEHCCTAKFVL